MQKAITISNFILLSAIFTEKPFLEKGSSSIINWMANHPGCVLIHLPGIGYWEMWQLIHEIPTHFHKRLILAQHHELRREFGIRGLHFSADRPYTPADYEGKVLGMTTHGFEEALRWGHIMNYLILQVSNAYAQAELHHFKRAFRGKAHVISYSSLPQIS